MPSLLVTGGAGFVGSHISCGIAERHPGWKVTALDNLRRRGSERNVERLKKYGVDFLHGDVRNPSDWPERPEGPQYIIDCAAEASAFAGLKDNPRYIVESNLMGTHNCLEYARLNNSAVIFISTSRTYPIVGLESLPFLELKARFDLPQDFKDDGVSYNGVTERFNMSGARSLYGCTKLASELLLEEYGAAYGLRYVINRCGTITGPGQMGRVEQGVFALWIAAHYFKLPLNFMGYGGMGKQVRGFLHIDDLVNLIDWQIGRINELSGERFNVGGGRPNSLSLLELTDLARNVTGNSVDIGRKEKMRKNDLRWYITNNSKVTSRCGWSPRLDTVRMAEDILKWFKDEGEKICIYMF